jgi:hypothetical protein
VTPDLPFVDEHDVTIAAPPEVVWPALLHVVDRAFRGGAGVGYARAVGCEHPRPSGPRPLTAGATITGFVVERAEPHRELALRGRHRFSTYLLTLRLDDLDGSTRLRAETRAAFPGVLGAAYRTAVIRTRGHGLVVRRLLGAVRRRATSG